MLTPRRRRALRIAVALAALVWTVLALVHVFGWADVPGGRLFFIGTGPALAAATIVNDALRRTPASRGRTTEV